MAASKFIKSWDFSRGNDVDKFDDAIRELDLDECKESDLRDAVKLFQNQVCNPQNVTVIDKEAVEFAVRGLEWIMDLVGSNDFEDTFNEVYLAMALTFLEAGPSSTHLALLSRLRRQTSVFDSYLETISADKLRPVIATMKRSFIQLDTVLTLEEYVHNVKDTLNVYILSNISSEQWDSCRVEFIDLYMYYLEQQCSASKEIAGLYEDVLHSLSRGGDGIVFKSEPPHLESLRRGLKIVRAAVASPKFSSMEYIRGDLADATSYIVKAVNKNGPMLEELLDDLMQTVIVVSKGRNDKAHLRINRELEDIFREDAVQAHFKNKPKLFEKYCPLLTELGNTMQGPVIMGRFVRDFTSDFLHIASGGNAAHFKLWVPYITMCVTQPHTDFMRAATNVIRDNRKVLKWKENIQAATSLFNAICELRCPEEPLDGAVNDLEKRDLEYLLPNKVADEQADFMENFLEQMKTLKLLPHLQESLVRFTLHCLESRSPVMFSIGKDCTDFIALQKNKDLAKPILVTLDRLFRDDDFPWDDHGASEMGRELVENIIESYKDGKDMAKVNDLLISLFLTAMNKDHTNYENGSLNMFGLLILGPLTKFVQKHEASNTAVTLVPLLGDMLRHLDHDDETVQQLMQTQFSILARSDATLFAQHIDILLDKYLANRDYTYLQILGDAYPANPKAVNARFQELMDIAEDMESTEKTFLFLLMSKIAANNYKVFTLKNMEYLMGEPLDNSNTEATVLSFLWSLSQKAAVLFKLHVDKLIKLMTSPSQTAASLCPMILANVGAVCKDQTEKIYKAIVDAVKSGRIDNMFINSMLHGLRTLLMINPEIGRADQTYFQELGEKQPSLKDMCRAIDDVIEGRSLEKVSDDLEQQALEIANLDNRVTETEDNVATLDREVGGQKKDIIALRTDVDEHGERLIRMQEVVDETVMKVEEIDMKTISNAPAFSKPVSKLLNPDSDHDWRLLAQRLGYSVDDIRGWATQSDPCMALLSEWYSTHRTSEATHAVLKTLKEINRVDAAEIIDKWLESVKDIIDDEPPDYATPPPVFLSYQWGHQAEVKLLRKHLGMAGYECWMDVGQMGGGDKLFAKIDQGIRAAKLVICCVTEKYALSPNCNREVTLAVNLGKPIIPLLVESLSWPPPGSMGPIFSEYLYVRFFLGETESHPPGIIWPMNSFQELLMQLNYNKIMPEQDNVAAEYKNWWQPPDEEIIVPVREKKGDSKTQSAATSEAQQLPGVPPEVFLSYQWGMQPQVKALYKVLTGQGYRVWMDIHQMGGGDSLYDKIDKGIRGCRVIVSCVTENYTKSANCRREVSLGDAIKKPIVPLLLESAEWPPKGPMGMVFSQLLYIDMCAEVSSGWGGKKFEELVAQLRGYVPEAELTRTETDTNNSTKPEEAEKIQPTQTKPVSSLQPSAEQESKDVPTIAVKSTKAVETKNIQPSKTKPIAAVQPSSRQEDKTTPQPTSASYKASPPTSAGSKSSSKSVPLPKTSVPKPSKRPSSGEPKKSKSCALI